MARIRVGNSSAKKAACGPYIALCPNEMAATSPSQIRSSSVGVDQPEDRKGKDDVEQRPADVDGAAADPVRQRAERRNGRQLDENRDERRGRHDRFRYAATDGIRGNQHRVCGEHRALQQLGAATKQQLAPVRFESGAQRMGFVMRLAPEQRRLRQTEPDVEADHDQKHAHQERDPPSP